MAENKEINKVVTRFAPSPTGFMHVGGVRTALYAYLWAKKHKGIFIFRIEDTDKEREVEGSLPHMIKSLKWLGLDWNQGPDIGGPSAPYIQSQRLPLYKEYALKLVEKGLAYPDPYSHEELESFRKKAEYEKRPFLYRDYRPENFEAWDGKKALRFKTPEIKSYHWNDAVRGDLSAGVEALDDFILMKSDGYPTYNFAHIIDDLQMGVTHIMRADEFIASTPRFLSLYDALEINPPTFVTLPPILAPGGNKKLSKRDGAKDILDYKSEGYLSDAVVNFLALLGWNPGGEKEIFTREELIQVFDISRIQVSGAQMNLEKLEWMNKEHIKLLSKEEIEKNILEWLPEGKKDPKLVPVIIDRISKWE
jgi:glutamyl-tRNA synthetase